MAPFDSALGGYCDSLSCLHALEHFGLGRYGDAVDFEIEDVVPFGVETGEPVRIAGMFHPAGSEFRVAEAKRTKINGFGIEYQGKSALSAPSFSWAA